MGPLTQSSTDGTVMKYLLTSAGIKNDSIRAALADMLGKPIQESTGLCIPTAIYGFPGGGEQSWKMLNGQGRTPLCEIGWASLGVLELTTCPTLPREVWLPSIEAADALLVFGGDSLYLSHWVRESGLLDLMPSLEDKVWVGVSGGSMATAPRVGDEFLYWPTPDGTDRALGLVDFAIFPHLDHPDLPENQMADAERWAAALDVPAYAIDDQTAIEIIDDHIEVVSEGNWRHFTPAAS